MFDTIAEISPDSISLYLKREISATLPDTADVGFSLLEIIPTNQSHVQFDVDSIMAAAASASSSVSGGFSGVLLPAFQTIHTILFLLFLFCLAALSFWSNKEGMFFVSNFKELFSDGSGRKSIYKEQVTASSIWGGIYLVFQTVLVATMVLFYALFSMGGTDSIAMSDPLLFGLIFSGILLLVIVKYLVYRLTGYVFPEWGFSAWTGRYFSLVGMAGLLMYIPAMFYIFTPEFSNIALIALLVLFFVVVIIIFRNLLVIFVKNKTGLLNYFLYLCAIEIVPLFLLYKGVIVLM